MTSRALRSAIVRASFMEPNSLEVGLPPLHELGGCRRRVASSGQRYGDVERDLHVA